MSKAFVLMFSALIGMHAVAQTSPAVKKSNSGICHEKGSKYYEQTKSFTPYASIEECVKSGGRLPKK